MPGRPYFWVGFLLGPARPDSPRKSWMGKVGGESVPGVCSCRPIAVEVRWKRLTGLNKEKLGTPIRPTERSVEPDMTTGSPLPSGKDIELVIMTRGSAKNTLFWVDHNDERERQKHAILGEKKQVSHRRSVASL